MQVHIPYGRTKLQLELPDENVKAVLAPETGEEKHGADQAQLVLDAMAKPIDSAPLSELAKGKKRVVLIASDHTRPVPSKLIVPPMLQEIRQGSPDAEIVILIATGSHRDTTREELIEKFGQQIVERERIEIHRATESEQMFFLGILPSGGELWLNKWAQWADMIVSEGFIEPHFFAGFSGGRKSILPGISSVQTVYANHCAKFIDDPRARTGILEGNPIHEDMVYAVKAAGLAYIVNVVLDEDKNVIAAFAGNPITAHEAGCALVGKQFRVKAVAGDIVITSNGGYPLDQNIYQSVKGMTAAECCVRPGGVIIISARCNNGHGGEDFFRYHEGRTPRQVYDAISAVPQEKTEQDQWQSQILARVMLRAHVIMVSDQDMESTITAMGMGYAPTLEAALEAAYEKTEGREIVVIPDGVGIILNEGDIHE